MKKLNWSTPKTNVFAGLNDLRKALASGMNARLIREWNQDCNYPIKTKNNNTDFRCYECYAAYTSTREKIQNDERMPEFQKHLSLNYIQAFGTEDAMNTYYNTGVLTANNFKGIGRAHLVNVDDYIAYMKAFEDKNELIGMYTRQYREENYTGSHFFNYYSLKRKHNTWNIKRFNNKLWVVELLGDEEPKARIPFMVKVLNVLTYPFKFVPKKSVLRMDKYKVVSFTIGDVTNGFSIEFQIPKKFSFN